MIEFLEPWVAVGGDAARALEEELARELASDHVLAGAEVHAVARRGDNDDVLFEVVGRGYAVVHLTWSAERETGATWPSTQLYDSLDQWLERGMT